MSEYVTVEAKKPDARYKKPRIIIKGIDFRDNGEIYLDIDFSAHHCIGGGWLKVDTDVPGGRQLVRMVTEASK